MSDLISREALMEYARNDVRHTIDCNDIARFPAVDAEPVRYGRWVKAQGMMPPEYHHRKCCDLCGGWAPQDLFGRERMSLYCPNCGAKMDGGAEDDHQGT